MKRFPTVLMALTLSAAAIAIAPTASASIDFDQLRRENVDKDAVNFS
ncbi:MAG: hypothetical protein AAFX01_00815 [Cyanobacteria bacterium J06638_28]